MSTQRSYKDICVLCGRELVGNGSKLYWSAFRIREVKPEYKGEIVTDQIYGVPHEKGAYVCRSRVVCEQRRQP